MSNKEKDKNKPKDQETSKTGIVDGDNPKTPKEKG